MFDKNLPKRNKTNQNQQNLKNKQDISEPFEQIENMTASTIDYESLPHLIGIPTIGSMIAFKMVEISSHFTPEISAFKVFYFYTCVFQSFSMVQ